MRDTSARDAPSWLIAAAMASPMPRPAPVITHLRTQCRCQQMTYVAKHAAQSHTIDAAQASRVRPSRQRSGDVTVQLLITTW